MADTLGGNPDVLGRVVTLQGEPHVVIGVLPSDFHFAMADRADFWAAIRGPQACWEVRTCRSLETVARLADGGSDADGQSRSRRRRAGAPGAVRNPIPETVKLIPLRDVMLGDVRPIMLMLLSGAALLLLIACIDSGQSAAGPIRQPHTGDRRPQRARRVLCAADAAVRDRGVDPRDRWRRSGADARDVGHTASSAACSSADMISRMPYLQGIGLNVRLIAVTCVFCVMSAMVFTLTPVLRLSVSEHFAGLKEGTRGSAGTTWRRFGSYLVAAELAITVVLLVNAGLLGKSFYRLLHVDPGVQCAAARAGGRQPGVGPACVASFPARVMRGRSSQARSPA